MIQKRGVFVRSLSRAGVSIWVFAAIFFGLSGVLHAGKDLKVFKGVLLDPGHGGEPEQVAELVGEDYAQLKSTIKQGYREECYGSITAGGYKEKTATLAVARKVGDLLRKEDLAVAMTRDRDVYVGLNERVAMSMDSEFADWLMVSIHFNRSSVKQQAINLSPQYQAARGFEVYVLPARGRRSTAGSRAPLGFITANQTRSANRVLAEKMKKNLMDIPGMRSRGIKEAWFVVLRGSPIPSVLIECGFMSNPEEGRLIATDDYQNQLAESIVQGILDYRAEATPPDDGIRKTSYSPRK